MTDYVQRFDKMSEDEKFAIISALGNRTNDADDLLTQVMVGTEDGTYTVHIEVNGVEVHAQDFIHRYINAIDNVAMRKADEMLREKFQEMAEAFEPIKEMLSAAEESLAQRFGVRRDSWGDY